MLIACEPVELSFKAIIFDVSTISMVDNIT